MARPEDLVDGGRRIETWCEARVPNERELTRWALDGLSALWLAEGGTPTEVARTLRIALANAALRGLPDGRSP